MGGGGGGKGRGGGPNLVKWGGGGWEIDCGDFIIIITRYLGK